MGQYVSCLIRFNFLMGCLFNVLIGTHVQARRKDEKLALAEYYEKHGGPAHH